MRAIVCSEKDSVSENVFNYLTRRGFTATPRTWEGLPIFQLENTLLVRTQELHVHADHLCGLDVDEIVFASRHSAAEGRSSFLVHPVGNFGAADLGGKPRALSPVNAQTVRNIFTELKQNKLGWTAGLEATHHGPFLDKPCVFAEIGSTQAEWENQEAAAFLAKAILNGMRSSETAEPVIGIGKGHYVPRLCDLAKRYAFGHMCPEHALNFLDKNLLDQMIEKTFPRPHKILVDKRVQTPAFLRQANVEVKIV